MKDTTYNGWTNYATWRVNLEMFDGSEEAGQWTADSAREFVDMLYCFVANDVVDVSSKQHRSMKREIQLCEQLEVLWCMQATCVQDRLDVPDTFLGQLYVTRVFVDLIMGLLLEVPHEVGEPVGITGRILYLSRDDHGNPSLVDED